MKPKQKILAYFFVVLGLANGLSLFFAFSNFKFYQETAELKYCVNKDASEFDCGGQCYFMKKMNVHKNLGSLPLNDRTKISLPIAPVFFQRIEKFSFQISFSVINTKDYSEDLIECYPPKFFQPPEM